MHKVGQGLSEFAWFFIIIRHDSRQKAHSCSVLLLIIIVYAPEKINLLIILRLQLFVYILEAGFAPYGRVSPFHRRGNGISFVAFEHVNYYDENYY